MNGIVRRGLVQMLVVVCLTQAGLAQQAVSRAGVTGSIPRSVAFNGQVVTWKDRARVGTLLLTFGLYTEQRDDAPLWTEQQQITILRC